MKIKDLFIIEKKPQRGLLAVEWITMSYMVFTLLMMLFMWTKLVNPEPMLWGRFQYVAVTLAMWVVYRMVPCRLTMLARIIAQMAFLGWWYPDTYELNRMLPNLDYVFAQWEQNLFGCQPVPGICVVLPPHRHSHPLLFF